MYHESCEDNTDDNWTDSYGAGEFYFVIFQDMNLEVCSKFDDNKVACIKHFCFNQYVIKRLWGLDN